MALQLRAAQTAGKWRGQVDIYKQGEEEARREDEERLKIFIQQLALGDIVLVFWSAKYWNSAYCLAEMMLIYLHSPKDERGGHRLKQHGLKIFVLDGQRLSDSGPICHSKWEKDWLTKAEKRLRRARRGAKNDERRARTQLGREAAHEWFEFVFKESEFNGFVEALLGYRLGLDLCCPKSQEEAVRAAAEHSEAVLKLLDEPDEPLKP